MNHRSSALKRLAQLYPGLLLAAAPLILFAPVWLAGKALFWGTPALQFVPWRWAGFQMLARLELPLWNSLSGMGAPLLANYQTAFLYPPNWLLFALQTAGDALGESMAPAGYNLGLRLAAWGQALVVVLHLAWASVGMARLARRLGLNPLAQLISGMSFGLSGYLVARAGFLSINAAAAWLPWSILAAEKLSRPARGDHRIQIWLSSSLVFAMLLLAGHAQTAWYILLLSGVWVVVCSPRAVRSSVQPGVHAASYLKAVFRAVVLLGASVFMGCLLSAAQLLPTGEYLLQSQRAAQVDYQTAMTYSFWPWHFITLLAPGFFGSPASGDYWGYANYWEDAVYIGVLPLLLALSAAFQAFRRGLDPGDGFRSLTRLLLAITAISFLLALGDNTAVFPWLYRSIPTFDMFQAPSRFSLWAVFALALLAGTGAHHWRRPQGAGIYWLRLGTMGALAITLGSGLGWIFLGDVSPTFVRAAAISGLWGVVAGLLALYAPETAGELNTTQGEPALRRMLRKIWPSLVRAGSEAKVERERSASSENRLLRSRTGLHLRLVQLWPELVLVVVAVDLVSAGWGLNPAISLDFYTRSMGDPELLDAVDTERRVFLPEDAERTIKFDRFLRFDTFTPEMDWHHMRDALLPNLNLLDGIASTNNFDPLVPGRYARWMQALDPFDPELHAWKLNLMGVGMVENMVNAPNRLVEYTVLPDAVRWRWLPCAYLVVSEENAWEQVMLGGPRLLSEYVIVEGEPAAGVGECAERGAEPAVIRKISEGAVHLELQVSSRQDGWLFIADTWYPGWAANLDGHPVQVLRGNYLFRTLPVPAGDHHIRLEYTPAAFRIGAAASLAGWLVCILLLSGAGIRRRSQVRD